MPFSWSYSGIEWWVWTLIIIGVLGVGYFLFIREGDSDDIPIALGGN